MPATKSVPNRKALTAFSVLAAALIAFDQLSKAHVRARLTEVGQTMPGIPGVFRFELVRNTGAAFSMGEGNQLLFVLVAFAVTAIVIAYLARSRSLSWGVTVSLTMVVGGALGNVIDRFFLGYVTDFVDLTFMDFAVFNFADMCITCGCALFIICLLAQAAREGRAPSADDQDPEPRP